MADGPESYSDRQQRMTPTAEDREYAHRMSTKETSWIPVGRHTWKLVKRAAPERG